MSASSIAELPAHAINSEVMDARLQFRTYQRQAEQLHRAVRVTPGVGSVGEIVRRAIDSYLVEHYADKIQLHK
jgi:hypothetical protein